MAVWALSVAGAGRSVVDGDDVVGYWQLQASFSRNSNIRPDQPENARVTLGLVIVYYQPALQE